MTESHTPGPWHWGNNYNGLYGAGGSDVLHWEPYEGMWLQYENQEQNARLISAAPDMLAALRAVVDAGDEYWSNDFHVARCLAKAAIDKATGA